MLVISVRKTQRYWFPEDKHDRFRDIDDTWYMVHRKHLLPFEVLVEWLRNR